MAIAEVWLALHGEDPAVETVIVNEVSGCRAPLRPQHSRRARGAGAPDFGLVHEVNRIRLDHEAGREGHMP